MGRSIPHVIHQTFPTRTLPDSLLSTVAVLREQNPSFEYFLYDDSDTADFVRSEYGLKTLRAFLSINPGYGAARADFFRYLVLYRMGGVYLDIKSTFTSPLAPLLSSVDGYLLSHWPNSPGDIFEGTGLHHELAHIAGGEYQQCFIIAAPAHPFLEAVIDNVLRNVRVYNPFLHGTGKSAVVRVTGPVAYSLAIAPHVPYYAHTKVANHKDVGFVYSTVGTGRTGPDGHESLFKGHYSARTDSLIVGDAWPTGLISAGLRLKSFLRKVRSG